MNRVLIGVVVTVILTLFGIVHGIQNGRLGKVEEGKADKEVVERMMDSLTGKGGIKETLIRIDERVKFLWEAKNGKGGGK